MRLNKDERSLPVLLAYERDENGNLAVWCPYCACWHLHGQGEGHRSAHCQNRRSPFIKTGYIIKKGSKKDYEFKSNTYFGYQYEKLNLKYADDWIENPYSKLGYYKNSFVLPNEIIGQDIVTFVPVSIGDKQYTDGFVGKGSFEDWKENVFNLIKEKPFALTFVLASFTSLLNEKFDVAPFIVELSGYTSTGKTICMKIAASVWGDPEEIRGTWNTTLAGARCKASLVNNIPLFFDNTRTTTKKEVSSVVYQFMQGSKTLYKNSAHTPITSTWKNILLSTGEDDITKFKNVEEFTSRIIPLTKAPFSRYEYELVDNIEINIRKYFGTAGKLFATWLIHQDLTSWEIKYTDLYNQYKALAEKNDVMEHLAKYMSLIHLSALMLNECFDAKIQDSVLYDVWNHILKNQ